MPRVWAKTPSGEILWVAQTAAGYALAPLLGPHPISDLSSRAADRHIQAYRDAGMLAGKDPEAPPCDHARKTRNLYDQRPRSEGRKLVPRAHVCEDCGAFLPREHAAALTR